MAWRRVNGLQTVGAQHGVVSSFDLIAPFDAAGLQSVEEAAEFMVQSMGMGAPIKSG